jgi:hypothetical protein
MKSTGRFSYMPGTFLDHNLIIYLFKIYSKTNFCSSVLYKVEFFSKLGRSKLSPFRSWVVRSCVVRSSVVRSSVFWSWSFEVGSFEVQSFEVQSVNPSMPLPPLRHLMPAFPSCAAVCLPSLLCSSRCLPFPPVLLSSWCLPFLPLQT